MKNKVFLLLSLSILLQVNWACNQSKEKSESSADAASGNAVEINKLIKEAYVYGLPLVLMDITRQQLNDPERGPLYSPPNQFKHNSSFPDASFRNVVRPNADTYYSSAVLDLSEGPIVLSLPNTNGRYYMMPMLDAYSNIFAAPGTRTTGNEAGKYLVCGPDWQGEVPADMKKIAAPTNMVWIIGRTQVNSKEDGDKVVIPLQKQYVLSPLTPAGEPKNVSSPKGDPNSLVKEMSTEVYFNYVNQMLARYPPPAADSALLSKFAELGIGAGKTFKTVDFPEEARNQIDSVPFVVLAELQQENSAAKDLVNGWNMGRKVIGTYGTDYRSRASVALFGLGANLREDAIYPMCQVDVNGNPLDGSKRYVIHFDKGQTPPANAFWSLTLYDNEGYFVANPINRYSLGDRSKLNYNADGSFDIYLQTEDPGKDKNKNWLPTPAGSFNLLLRVYWPKEEMLNGNWKAPGVVPQ